MTAAHGGWNSEELPLGGGAAVCERLCAVWGQDPHLRLSVFGSGPSGPSELNYQNFASPKRADGQATHPANLSEWAYASFCRQFENEVTDHLLSRAKNGVVIVHDISEAPNFGRLARAGIRCIPIFHVDVVDYFNRFYLKDLLPAAWWTGLHRSTRQWLPWPDVLQLVFEKQRQALEHCPYVVVPSSGMKSKLLRCYPNTSPQRVQVVPWGAPLERYQDEQLDAAVAELSRQWQLPPESPVICTLSRISPEKNQVALLESLKMAELAGRTPLGLTVIIAGAPAYMRGQAYLRQLEKRAAELRKTRVIFAGHLAGLQKAALLRRAQLMVVASSHESYGLTTLEAFHYGLPVVGLQSDGVCETIDGSCGRVVPLAGDYRRNLWIAIEELLGDPHALARLSAGAGEVAAQHTFMKAAERLLELARRVAPC